MQRLISANVNFARIYPFTNLAILRPLFSEKGQMFDQVTWGEERIMGLINFMTTIIVGFLWRNMIRI